MLFRQTELNQSYFCAFHERAKVIAHMLRRQNRFEVNFREFHEQAKGQTNMLSRRDE